MSSRKKHTATGATVAPTKTGPEKVNPVLENSAAIENGAEVSPLTTTGNGTNIANAKHAGEIRESKNAVEPGTEGAVMTTNDKEGRNIEVPQNPSYSHVQALNAATSDDIEIKLPLGRPINPESERQKRLAGYEAKKVENGGLHRGRPKNPESANAKKQAAREERLRIMKEQALAAQKLNEEAGAPANIIAMVKVDGNVQPAIVAADPSKVAEMMEANELAAETK